MHPSLLNRVHRRAAIALGALVPSYRWGESSIVNVPGFFTEGDIVAYRELCGNVPAGGLVIEVGSWKGRSILNAATTTPHVRFIAIDTFLGSQFERTGAHVEATRTPLGVYPLFLRNLLRTGAGNVSVLRLTSVEAAAVITNASADLVFVDAGHSEPEVLEDIEHWRVKVKPGGILAGHDLHNERNEIARAVFKHFSPHRVQRFSASSVWAVRL